MNILEFAAAFSTAVYKAGQDRDQSDTHNVRIIVNMHTLGTTMAVVSDVFYSKKENAIIIE